MRVEGFEEGGVRGVGCQAGGGGEPLVYFCELGFGVGYLCEGGHFAGELGGVPDGEGEGASGEQLVGSFGSSGWFNGGVFWC